MGYQDPTCVILDGDEAKWAYVFMKGWKKTKNVDFDFRDAHDLDFMTSRAQSEDYVQGNLRERIKQASTVLVLEPPIRIETELTRAGITFQRDEQLEIFDTRTGKVDLVHAPEIRFEVDSFNRRVITQLLWPLFP